MASNKTGRPEVSLLERNLYMARPFYNRFLPDFFAAAQRFRIPSAMRLRAAADMVRFFGAATATAELPVALLALPGGRPRRFPPPIIPPPEAPLTPSRARMAASSRLRSSLSCTTISERFMRIS